MRDKMRITFCFLHKKKILKFQDKEGELVVTEHYMKQSLSVSSPPDVLITKSCYTRPILSKALHDAWTFQQKYFSISTSSF